MEKPESNRIMKINWRLPPHIIQVIFSKLPIVSLPACRIVCKAWNDLVLNYVSTCKIIPKTSFLCTRDMPKMHCIDFDPKHLEGMSFVASFGFNWDWSSITIVNSCNGLLFIFKFGKTTPCPGILNPMTNEFIKLPVGNDPYAEQDYYARAAQIYCYGFGFSPKTKRYKIARVSFDIKKSSTIFEIFTFGGSNQWSCVDSLSYVIIRKNGVYFNGALYWIGIDKKNGYEYVICRLDVENDKIETTISLSEIGPGREVSIGEFNGRVYATFFFMDDPCYKIEVWMMRSYRGEDSWTREFVINDIPRDWASQGRRTVFFKLIQAYGDGEILCLVNHGPLFLYNPKIGSIKTLNQFEQETVSWVCQIESLNFGSLQKILAGDDG